MADLNSMDERIKQYREDLSILIDELHRDLKARQEELEDFENACKDWDFSFLMELGLVSEEEHKEIMLEMLPPADLLENKT